MKGQVYQLYCAPLAFTVANNQTILAAITGKRIRVMGLDGYSDAAGGSVVAILDGSGGTVLYRAGFSSAITQTPKGLPITDSGYFETSTGVGLFMNAITTAGAINVFYIAYTP
jgi:hypothetical protein